MKKRSLVRSLVAGALIGVAEAAPLGAIRRTPPLRVVWIDDRELPDPLEALPIMLLDPVPLASPSTDRAGPISPLRLTLYRADRLLRRLGTHFRSG